MSGRLVLGNVPSRSVGIADTHLLGSQAAFRLDWNKRGIQIPDTVDVGILSCFFAAPASRNRRILPSRPLSSP